MSKFKEGDWVIIKSNPYGFKEFSANTWHKISGLQQNGIPQIFSCEYDGHLAFHESRLELVPKEIVNSPLFKALQEEEE